MLAVNCADSGMTCATGFTDAVGSDALAETIAAHRRHGIPHLIDVGDRDGRGEVTWRYLDGSQGFGSRRDFEDERDLAITLDAARSSPLAEAYYARYGQTLQEIPLARAELRELLLLASGR